jgi:hypothetical protein
MRILKLISTIAVAALVLSGRAAEAQDGTNLAALRGLAPVSALSDSKAGRVALAKNLAITRAIQDGSAHQSLLLSFGAQQQRALRDAFITDANAEGLADGLGSRLGGAYQSSTGCQSNDDGKHSTCPNISDAVRQLIAYAYATTSADATSGKYFFANGTTDGKTSVSPEANSILTKINGTTDFFGKAYGLPAGGPAADLYGNSRPFQTLPKLDVVHGKDFFGARSGSIAYLFGPTQNLTDSPSFPSGHTTYGYTEGLLLALLVSQRYPQMIARAAEYGNDRIILGAHYTMDVLGGRTLATYDMAQLLANKQGYVGLNRNGVKIDDFRKALEAARSDVTNTLEAKCGGTIAACARQDRSRFARQTKNRTFYLATQTYGLPSVFKQNAGRTEDVGKMAPEAGYLLTTAFPYLTLARANAILTETEGPGGGFLDDGSAFGVYSRLDLYRAAAKAIAENPAASENGQRHKVRRNARRAYPPRWWSRNFLPCRSG